MPVENLVFLDETGLKTNMVRRYGWSLRGERVIDRTPHGHWKTTTLVSALRGDRLEAPMVLDGAMNAASFLAYVEQILLPTLKPGDLVVMDNLSSHKSTAVQRAIASVGAQVLYLPPYSPDLNPIEMVYSKIKALVRAAAERSVEGLWALAGTLMDAFSADECGRYLHHCGYGIASATMPAPA